MKEQKRQLIKKEKHFLKNKEQDFSSFECNYSYRDKLVNKLQFQLTDKILI